MPRGEYHSCCNYANLNDLLVDRHDDNGASFLVGLARLLHLVKKKRSVMMKGKRNNAAERRASERGHCNVVGSAAAANAAS